MMIEFCDNDYHDYNDDGGSDDSGNDYDGHGNDDDYDGKCF